MPHPGLRDPAAWVLRDLAAGVRTLVISRTILTGTVLVTGVNLAVYIIEGNLVYLVLSVEHQPKIALGMVFSAQGLGAIVGAGAAPRLIARYRSGHLLTAGFGLSAAAMVIPASTPGWPGIVAGQGIQGVATALIVVCWFSTLQRLIPADIIGRFVSVGRAIAYATIPLGALAGAGLLAASASARTVFAGAAGLQAAILLAATRSAVIRIDLWKSRADVIRNERPKSGLQRISSTPTEPLGHHRRVRESEKADTMPADCRTCAAICKAGFWAMAFPCFSADTVTD